LQPFAIEMTSQPKSLLNAIPWIHGAAFRPVFAFLRHLDISADRLLERSGLPIERLDLYRGVIPQHLLGHFVNDVVRLHGLPTFTHDAIVFARRANVHWAYSPPEETTLWLALKEAIIRAKGHTSTQFLLSENADTVSVLRRQTSLPVDAEFQFGIFGLEMMIQIARDYLGERWQPARIWIPGQLSNIPGLSSVFPYCPVSFLDDLWRFDIPRRRLATARGPQRITSGVSNGKQAHHGEPVSGSGFASVFGRIVGTYLRSGPLRLEGAAEIMRISTRTLQRRLRQAGLTFSEVVEENRFSVAKELLHRTNLPIIEIALELGYESPSSFARSFRRISGISPRDYRQTGPT